MSENGAGGTADEVKEVVLAENGLLLVSAIATIKSSVSEKGRIALFLGSNQLKRDTGEASPIVNEGKSAGTAFRPFALGLSGFTDSLTSTAFSGHATTGQLLSTPITSSVAGGGLAIIFAAAGTYNISIKYKSSEGSVTAKERKLWVATLG